MRKHLSSVVTFGVAVLVSGCGGGQSSAPVVPATAKTHSGPVTGSTKARLTIKMPIRKAGAVTKSSRRKPQYVSFATAGIFIKAGAPGDEVKNAPWQPFDVSSKAPLSLCSTSADGNFRTCVLSVTVPAPTVQPWTEEFQVFATDAAPLPNDTQPVGNVLSTGDTGSLTPVVVAVGAENPVNMTLTGVIGSLAPVLPSYSAWAAPGQTSNVSVGITANDAAGGSIAGNPTTFENPITFSDSLGQSTPFEYPSANLNPPPNVPVTRGLPPPATPGPILATVVYSAPSTGTTASTTAVVTVTTIPGWLLLPNGEPTTTFRLNTMVVSANGAPINVIPGLAVGGPDVTVTVNETGVKSYQLSATQPPDLAAAYSVSAITPPDSTGTSTFSVHPIGATNNPAAMITVTDDRGTVATLPVVVAAAPTPTPTPIAIPILITLPTPTPISTP